MLFCIRHGRSRQSIPNDLDQILKSIQRDLTQIKMDVGILAKLNHLDEVKKDARLFRVYGPDENLKEG
jgi:hypothetical protein